MPKAPRTQHPMLRPRPPVAFGLFAISLAGIGVMLWGIDRHQTSALIIGWTLAWLGALLTSWIYWPEIKKLHRFSTLGRQERPETVVAISIILIAVLLPPYFSSLRERASMLDVVDDIIVIDPEHNEPFAENIDLQNNGDIPVKWFNKGCFYWPSNSILPRDYEDAGVKKAKDNMDRLDITADGKWLWGKNSVRLAGTT
jgi:hypothetical protein